MTFLEWITKSDHFLTFTCLVFVVTWCIQDIIKTYKKP